jgi:transposase-like protein
MRRRIHPLLQGQKRKQPEKPREKPLSPRAFQKLWNDETISMQKLVQRLGYDDFHSASHRAGRYRKAGMVMIHRTAKGPRRQWLPYTEEQGHEIVRLSVEEGLSRVRISETLGIPDTRVKLVLQTFNRTGAVPTNLSTKKRAVKAGTFEKKPENQKAYDDDERTVDLAARMLRSRGHVVTFQRAAGGELIKLDGQAITVVRLFDLAYGEPTGKYL